MDKVTDDYHMQESKAGIYSDKLSGSFNSGCDCNPVEISVAAGHRFSDHRV